MNDFIGTSGFSYASWKTGFYPPKLKSSQWLAYYATRFNTLELNHTFYRFPRVEMLRKQAEAVPAEFRFSVKAHKIITHTLRMKAARDTVSEFVQVVEDGLGDKLGCILFQFPASFTYSPENMERILDNVPHAPRNVIEFRHESWWSQGVWDVLAQHGLTFCNVSFPGLPEALYSTGSVLYLRMHGVPDLFKSSYEKPVLKKLAKQMPSAEERYVYFNNTMYEAGYTNALELMAFLAEVK